MPRIKSVRQLSWVQRCINLRPIYFHTFFKPDLKIKYVNYHRQICDHVLRHKHGFHEQSRVQANEQLEWAQRWITGGVLEKERTALPRWRKSRETLPPFPSCGTRKIPHGSGVGPGTPASFT